HLLELARRRRPLALAEDGRAEGAMADEEGEVERQAASLDLVEVLANRAPVPAERSGHRADEQHALQRPAVCEVAEGPRRDFAIARYRGRDPLLRGRGEPLRAGCRSAEGRVGAGREG